MAHVQEAVCVLSLFLVFRLRDADFDDFFVSEKYGIKQQAESSVLSWNLMSFETVFSLIY